MPAFMSNELQLNVDSQKSNILSELFTNDDDLSQASLMIDHAFSASWPSRYGRRLLQDGSSFNSSQPSFIALLSVIAFLVVAILIAILILCCRHYSRRRHSKHRRTVVRNKLKRVLTIPRNQQLSNDQTHLAASITPSSDSSYSVSSSRRLFPDQRPDQQQQPQQQQLQNSSLGQSTNTTLPSMVPSRRLQQSMMDAYFNDLDSFHPSIIDVKQLNSYLFVDLHSTSSETFVDMSMNLSKQQQQQIHSINTTTSGYDTSTGGEDRNHKHSSIKYRRRRTQRRQHYLRQRRRSTLALKRSIGPRFLMRERSLPNNLNKLPQLRRTIIHPFGMKENHNNSTTTTTTTTTMATTNPGVNFSVLTDDCENSQAYHVNQSPLIHKTKDNQESPINRDHRSYREPYFFEMVSAFRGDDSDMPNYDEISPSFVPLKTTSPNIGDGIAYVNDSIIV